MGTGIAITNICCWESTKYGQSNKIKDTNEGSFHLRFTHYFPRFFPLETYGQVEFDQFKLLAVRKIMGAGLRFELVKTKKQFFYWGWGGFYENERIENLSSKNTKERLRGNFYLSYLFLSDRKKEFSLVIYYQPDLAVFSDYRLLIDSGLSIYLGRSFSLVHKVGFRRNNRSPVGVKADDIGYLAGISFKY